MRWLNNIANSMDMNEERRNLSPEILPPMAFHSRNASPAEEGAILLSLGSLCHHSGPEKKSKSQLGLNVKSSLLVQFIKRQFAYNSYLMCLQYIFTIDKINRGSQ